MPISDLFIDFAAGCLGGVAGVLAGHPLDTVKVRLQTQNLQAPQYRGTLHCFVSIVRQEGPAALYKGMSSPLASLALINAIIFGVHGHVSKQFSSDQQNALHVHFLAGAAAGAAQGFIASPMELLKLRAQVHHDEVPSCSSISNNCSSAKPKCQSSSPFAVARKIWREKGARYFSRGLLATQLRDCPAMGVYFASYALLLRQFNSVNDASSSSSSSPVSSWLLLCAGGVAGLCSWLCNYPTDVIKTRFQADDSYANYKDVIRRTYAERGLRTFFVGLGSTLIRAFPTNAATFFTVEWTCRVLLRPKDPQRQQPHKDMIRMAPDRMGLIGWHQHNHQLVLPVVEAGCTLQEPMIM